MRFDLPLDADGWERLTSACKECIGRAFQGETPPVGNLFFLLHFWDNILPFIVSIAPDEWNERRLYEGGSMTGRMGALRGIGTNAINVLAVAAEARGLNSTKIVNARGIYLKYLYDAATLLQQKISDSGATSLEDEALVALRMGNTGRFLFLFPPDSGPTEQERRDFRDGFAELDRLRRRLLAEESATAPAQPQAEVAAVDTSARLRQIASALRQWGKMSADLVKRKGRDQANRTVLKTLVPAMDALGLLKECADRYGLDDWASGTLDSLSHITSLHRRHSTNFTGDHRLWMMPMWSALADEVDRWADELDKEDLKVNVPGQIRGVGTTGNVKAILDIQAKCREWGETLRQNGWRDDDTNTHRAAAETTEAKAAELAVMGLIKKHEGLLTYCRNNFVRDPSTSLDRAFDYIGIYLTRGPEALKHNTVALPECLTVEVAHPKVAEPYREPTFIVQLGRWAERLAETQADSKANPLVQDQGEQTPVKPRGGKVKKRTNTKTKGRPKITGKAETERINLISRWEKAHNAGVSKVDFCEDERIDRTKLGFSGQIGRITTRDLDNVLNWKGQRNKRQR